MENIYTHAPKNKNGKLTFRGTQPVELQRILNAPVEAVWKAWSTLDMAKQWWGPKNFTCPEGTMDFREGGKYVLAMVYPDGKKVEWCAGEYLEIVPNEKIVSSDYFSDEAGSKVLPSTYGHDGQWPSECYVTVTFEELSNNRCRMSLVHEGVPKKEHDGCVQGWSQSLDKLQNLVERH